jgi:hypothetical protein
LSIAIIASEAQRQAILPALRCAAAGHHVVTADTPGGISASGGATPWASLQFVVVDEAHAPTTLEALRDSGSKARVLLIGQNISSNQVKLALNHARVVGITASSVGAPEPWEMTYMTRRILAPADPTPSASQFLTWGVTNVAWTPRTTADLRRIVKQIDDISRNLGAERREANVVATAAHEMLMNAMYDAPVQEGGQPLYAFDRTAEISLADRHRPTFRLAVGPSYIGLDVCDPFGRLPRTRFFESIVRGLHGRADGGPLDTSHGGAGLGLYTLFANGSVLRAELRPMRDTHVSWMMRRGQAHRGRDEDRSLYFVALTEAR